VLHSKIRCSKPRSPREIRANPILCLQVGHIGRSAMERELRIPPHPFAPPRERAAREYVPAAPGLKIDLKTETATQPRCPEAIPCSGRLWSPKTRSRKRNTKATHSGGGFFARVSPVGRDGRLGFLDLDCGVNKSAANYWRGLDETAPAGGS
jgi:hypothetical protein